ncbi:MULTISPECIES: DUF421 domain-containing protein [unclassified Ruminococcus]|uniref:DUF421 domain-containing protein n=1 Tax=unclassified Ruminococcus TaxID=2608920 RepID=UPI00210D534F|nr:MULTISPECIES: DUF421 domain-containing protein [unclassified Ruminococcus]MCQ4022522.1 DUF421 domain-containing protein [Ruminococcus sp. zg-924]MCQ4115134.1 DUF421 domain-containing protein [Ruminococcus sp. zg-921]
MAISIIRTVILYAVIIIAVRLMGKRQIGEMQTSELVVTLLISDIASLPMQNTDQSLLSGFVPILILIICEIVLSVLMMKRAKFRRIVCGMPQIIIRKGKIDQAQMKKLRMSTEDLCEQLRQAGCFKLSQVEYAIIETNGKLSILKKPEDEPPSCSQLNIQPEKSSVETVVISDGELSKSSAKICGVSEQKINDILRSENTRLEDVFIMTANSCGEFKIIKRECKN